MDTNNNYRIQVNSPALGYGVQGGVGINNNSKIIDDFKLNNYPNPFNPKAMITFELKTNSHVNLTVYNSLGEKVKTLVNGSIGKGFHMVTFDATNLISGIYYYRLSARNRYEVKSMLLLK